MEVQGFFIFIFKGKFKKLDKEKYIFMIPQKPVSLIYLKKPKKLNLIIILKKSQKMQINFLKLQDLHRVVSKEHS